VTAIRLACRAILLLLDTSFAHEEFILHRLLFYCSVCVLTRTVCRLCFCWQHTWNDRDLWWRHIPIFHSQECCFINFCLCPRPSGIWKLNVHSEKPYDMVRATVIRFCRRRFLCDLIIMRLFRVVTACDKRHKKLVAQWADVKLQERSNKCQQAHKLHCLVNCFKQDWNLTFWAGGTRAKGYCYVKPTIDCVLVGLLRSRSIINIRV
jgi:hypothetical protein